MATTSIETVPMAAHEAQAERYTRIIVFMAIGWAVSVLLLSIIVLFAISTEIETVEEIVTTTEEVTQDADNYGSNFYAGGDMNNDGASDGQDNADANGEGDAD